jgi:hypothetical protein
MQALRSTSAQSFDEAIATWIDERGEILMLFRWPYGAGARTWQLFQDLPAARARLAELPEQTSVILLRDYAFPVRGHVQEPLISQAVAQLPDATACLIVGLDPEPVGPLPWYDYPHAIVGSHAELVSDLRENWLAKRVAIGPEPDWLTSHPGLIEAFVPDAAGVVQPAVY